MTENPRLLLNFYVIFRVLWMPMLETRKNNVENIQLGQE